MSMSSLSSLSDEERGSRRHIPDRINLFEKYDDFDFRVKFRFSKSVVLRILKKIERNIRPVTQRSKPVDALTQLLVTLRFYATGAFQSVLGDTINANRSTICRIVQKVTDELVKLSSEYIKMPTIEELQETAEDFYQLAGFPRVAGAVDSTHIKIISRGGELSEAYRCRKGYFSINVQVVCDAKLKIRDIIARWPGSVHDSTIFNNSHLYASFEMGLYGNHHLLGDSGYCCKQFLLTPFNQPQTSSEEAYNRSHITTHNTVERCIGVWKTRFPCLLNGMNLKKTETILKVIIATAVLHNIAIDLEVMDQPLDLSIQFDVEEDGNAVNGAEDTSVRTALVNTVFSM